MSPAIFNLLIDMPARARARGGRKWRPGTANRSTARRAQPHGRGTRAERNRGSDRAVARRRAPPANDPVLASALDGERIALEAGSADGLDTLALRCGGFYSADGWHTRILAKSIAKGRPVLIGRQSPVWSMTHTNDAADAFVTAAEAPKTGAWHIVDDRPGPLAEFLGEIAKRLDARPPRRMPAWLAELVLGRYGMRILSSSFLTSNARFRRDFNWQPSFPTYVEGLEEVVTSWRAEGFPARGS